MNKYTSLFALLICSTSFAYRDLETGTFLTRDPLRYADGPNLYCYVHSNPITKFDAVGLYAEVTHGKSEWVNTGKGAFFGREKVTPVTIAIEIMVINDSNLTPEMATSATERLKESTESKWSGHFKDETGSYMVKTEVTIKEAERGTSPRDAEKGNFNLVKLLPDSGKGANGETGGKKNSSVEIQIAPGGKRGMNTPQMTRTGQHEMGHVMGADHTTTPGELMRDAGKKMNPMSDVKVTATDITRIINEGSNDTKFDSELTVEDVTPDETSEEKTPSGD